MTTVPASVVARVVPEYPAACGVLRVLRAALQEETHEETHAEVASSNEQGEDGVDRLSGMAGRDFIKCVHRHSSTCTGKYRHCRPAPHWHAMCFVMTCRSGVGMVQLFVCICAGHKQHRHWVDEAQCFVGLPMRTHIALMPMRAHT